MIIDEYNHFMYGIDLIDQLIAYYCPKIFCHCIWMPIMLCSFDILCVNLYIWYRETSCSHPNINNECILRHNQFLIKFIDSLIHYAVDEDTTQETHKTSKFVIHHNQTAHHCLNRNNLLLSVYDDIHFLPGNNERNESSAQHLCKYCLYLGHQCRLEGVQY